MFGKSKKIKELQREIESLKSENKSVKRNCELENSQLKIKVNELEVKNTRALVELGKCRGFKRSDENYRSMIADQQKYIKKLIRIKNDYKNELNRMKIIDRRFGSRVYKYVSAIEVRRTTGKSFNSIAKAYEIGDGKLRMIYRSIKNDSRLSHIFKVEEEN